MRSQNKFLKTILFLGDIFFMYSALFLSLLARSKGFMEQPVGFFYSFLVLYTIWIFIIYVLSLYDLHFFKKPADFFFNLVIFLFFGFFVGVTYFYFRPVFNITPKTILLLNVIIFGILFLFWRYFFNLFLETRGVKERVVIVGFNNRLREIFSRISKIYEVEAVFCPPSDSSQKICQFLAPDIDIISEISDLKKIVAEKKITSVIFALDFYSNKDLTKKIFYALPLILNYTGADDLYEYITKKVSLEDLNEIWFLEKISKPEDKLEQIVKRLFDIVLSIVGLLLFAIFYPFIALAIKIEDRGNIFYTQKRVGKNGKIFLIHKFRTMREAHDQNSKVWREKDNENITKVGAVLRKLHLDELPQAWNIFKGELSFVGPRAEWQELAKVFEKEIPFYKQRYLVKPGLVGWAQINFPASKSIAEAKEKFEYDLYYIKNHSILLDIEIILKAIKLFLW